MFYDYNYKFLILCLTFSLHSQTTKSLQMEKHIENAGFSNLNHETPQKIKESLKKCFGYCNCIYIIKIIYEILNFSKIRSVRRPNVKNIYDIFSKKS